MNEAMVDEFLPFLEGYQGRRLDMNRMRQVHIFQEKQQWLQSVILIIKLKCESMGMVRDCSRQTVKQKHLSNQYSQSTYLKMT